MATNGEERFDKSVSGAAEALRTGDDYVTAVSKIITGHTVNELVGAQVFDEPAIGLAPTPYDKWLTCRIAMEEYGHHVQFKRLAVDLGIEDQINMERSLSIFEFPMKTFPDFMAVKALADLAEILQMEDLLECSYQPLKNLSEKLMPEEKFHAGFGKGRLRQLCKSPEGREEGAVAFHQFFPVVLPFFGRSQSRNNDLFRKWGIKRHTNGYMRGDFIHRSMKLCEEIGIDKPEAPKEYLADVEEYKNTMSEEGIPTSRPSADDF